MGTWRGRRHVATGRQRGTGASVEAGATGASVGDGQRGAWGCMLGQWLGLGAGRPHSTPNTPMSSLENRNAIMIVGLGNVREGLPF